MSERHVQRGIKKFLKGNYSESEDDFVQAVEINDISSNGWYYLGLCRQKENDVEGMTFCFKKAITAAKIQEDDFVLNNSLLELAKIHIKTDQNFAAMGYLRKLEQGSLKDNDLLATVYEFMGEIYERMNKNEYALFYYLKSQNFGSKKSRRVITQLEERGIVADDPDDKNSPNMTKRRADLLFNQQKFQESIHLYQKCLEDNITKQAMNEMDQAVATMKIGYAYINIQDFSKAKDYLVQSRNLFNKIQCKEDVMIIDSTLFKIQGFLV